jgi:hypothetical protein
MLQFSYFSENFRAVGQKGKVGYSSTWGRLNGPGGTHEGNELGFTDAVKCFSSVRHAPGGALRGAVSLGASGGSVDRHFRVQCANRTPLAETLRVCALNSQTRNVSASGVLFALDRELKVGLAIRFSLRMPGGVLGASHDVLVHCTGRVVRCSLSHHQYLAASTIDDYQFAEQ